VLKQKGHPSRGSLSFCKGEEGTSGDKSPRSNPVQDGDDVLDRREPLQIRGEHAARGFLAFLKRLAIKGPQVGSQVQAIFLGRRTQHDFPHRYTRRSLFPADYDSTWNHFGKSMFNRPQTCRSFSVHLDVACFAPPDRPNSPFGRPWALPDAPCASPQVLNAHRSARSGWYWKKKGGERRGADGTVAGADPLAIGETGKTTDVPHAVASG
jgi:hypothetical protein